MIKNFVRSYLRMLSAILLFATVSETRGENEWRNVGDPDKPNIVLIYIDDLGYADIGPFGARGYATPNLDRMASEGRKFTDFVVSSAVCSASRAALMTGCYHVRVGIHGAFGPNAKQGISADETTLAEVCKTQGYATACFGKWHLGNHQKFLPLQHGFDEYFGLPYSNDMWPLHPSYADLNPNDARRKQNYPDLPLINGNEIFDPVVTGDDQAQLTTLYTDHALDFIERNKDQPFFLYVPHSMVHVPLFVSEKFKGKSQHGLFGDVMMEVDWSIGQILDKLRSLGLEKKTLVIFCSDNGPWLSYGDHAGSAAPLREGKGTMWEGGVRVPTVMSWPGKIAANTTCDELASTIDVLPTVAKLIEADLPPLPIDGLDISSLLFAEPGSVNSPHESFYYYYNNGELRAVRDRQWKLVFPHNYQTLAGKVGGSNGTPAPYIQAKVELSLFDLKKDVGESHNVIEQHPEIAKRLMEIAEESRQKFGDKLTGRQGNEIRQAGKVDD